MSERHPDSALSLLDATFAQAAELLPTVAWRSDAEGNIEYVNEEWTQQTGHDASAALGAGWTIALPHDERESVLSSWRSLIAAGRPFELQTNIYTVEGFVRRYRFLGRPKRDADGAVARWFGVCVRIDADVARGTLGEPVRSESIGEAKRRVLVVEDNRDTRILIERMLARVCEVVCAENTKAALHLVRTRSFDVILVDVHLGNDASGLDLLKELREIPSCAATPVAAVTAYALPGDRERFLKAGFSHYLGKPFTAAELYGVLRDLSVLQPA